MRELVSERAMIGVVLVAMTFGLVVLVNVTSGDVTGAIVWLFAFVVAVGGTAWAVRRQSRQALQE